MQQLTEEQVLNLVRRAGSFYPGRANRTVARRLERKGLLRFEEEWSGVEGGITVQIRAYPSQGRTRKRRRITMTEGERRYHKAEKQFGEENYGEAEEEFRRAAECFVQENPKRVREAVLRAQDCRKRASRRVRDS